MQNLVHVEVPLIHAALFAAAVLALVFAALHDCVARIVPNEAALALAVAGLGLRLLSGDAAMALLAAAVVFGIAALCWRAGWMGGGDVKLLGAAALVVPPGESPALITAIAATGLVLSLFYLAARRVGRSGPGQTGRREQGLVRRAWRVERWRMRRGGPLPYAVAIAGGSLCVLFQVTTP
jgi:prepilin peptidase CpaA